MLNIGYTHASVVVGIFDYRMVQNKQFNRYWVYSVMSVVVLFAYAIKLKMLTTKGVTWILWKMLCNDFKLCCQCDEQNVGRKFV